MIEWLRLRLQSRRRPERRWCPSVAHWRSREELLTMRSISTLALSRHWMDCLSAEPHISETSRILTNMNNC